jgi:very-short-patch-repair endonuclease
MRYTKEEFIEKARKVHGDKYDYSKIKYIDMRTPVCIICRECGNEFWQAPYNHVNGSGCIHCHTLKSEKSVGLFLKEKGIKVIKQKRFKWLGQLRLDFYLPDYNIAIEYQGEQHFHPVKHFGGEKRYRDRIERDARKKCLCEQNNVKLLYVSFYKKPTYKVIDNLNDLLNIIKKI